MADGFFIFGFLTKDIDFILRKNKKDNLSIVTYTISVEQMKTTSDLHLPCFHQDFQQVKVTNLGTT